MEQIDAGFDDEVRRLLVREAAAARLSVEAYVREAVLMRLMVDVSRRGEEGGEALIERLRGQSGAAPAPGDADPSVAAVVHDPARLRALVATGLLDSRPEESFDRVARLAAEALAAPTAAVTLITDDRQVFKSAVGLTAELEEKRETPLTHSYCQYAVGTGQAFVVEDAREDPQLRKSLALREGNVLAYVGIPLTDSEGHALGALCVWDHRPRQWTRGHVQTLEDLARLIVRQIRASSGPPQSG